MDAQKNVLLVTNAVTETEIGCIKEAVSNARAQRLNLKLNLVHVIPSLPTCYFNIPSMVALTEQYYEEAKKCLSSVGELLEVTKKNQWLITGRIKSEVLRLANKLDSRFILASSMNIQDLRHSFPMKKERKLAEVRSVLDITRL